MKNKHPIDSEKKFEEYSKLTFDDFGGETVGAVYNKPKGNKTRALSLRINQADIINVKIVSRKKGIPYQSLIKSYIHTSAENDLKTISR